MIVGPIFPNAGNVCKRLRYVDGLIEANPR